jgi:hypothetical protein
MLACGVLAINDGEIDLVAVPPLPAEVLPLTEGQVAAEDEMRWRGLHEGPAQSVIALFDPDGDEPADEISTTLARLGIDLGIDPETARGAIALLISEGDFSSPAAIETATNDDTIVLRVDWEEFGRRRIRVHRGRAGDD